MDPSLRHDLIVGLFGVATSLGTWWNARNTRSLKVHINSRMDQLLEKTGQAEKAKGHAAGVEQERLRQNDRRVAP